MLIELGRESYRDKVYACWLGKNIGGTLGTPYEGQKHAHALSYYDPIPEKAAANDDLDLQLVWLQLLEDRGIDLSLQDLAEYWMKYLPAYPWNEYGYCMRNLERGLRPPISGCFENYWVDDMGAPIRSEIWACIAPGDPQRAAAMAWKDATLDHAGGEGVYGEMFWAAVESAAFVLDDPIELIRIGLRMIPISCGISRVIREAIWCWQNNVKWGRARQRIQTHFGIDMPCNAINNHGFTVLGWLYGTTFGERLCAAVNCGYDTDCTGATLGALLGIIGGTAGIPEEWRRPIGEEIVLYPYTGNIDAPKTISELTNRTVRIAEKLIGYRSDAVRFGENTNLPEHFRSLLYRNELARQVLTQDVHSAVSVLGDLEVCFGYGGDPVIYPGIESVIEVSVTKGEKAEDCTIELILPFQWRSRPISSSIGRSVWGITAEQVNDTNTISVLVKQAGETREGRFVILGPGEAKGAPAGGGVDKCPKCWARLNSCICK